MKRPTARKLISRDGTVTAWRLDAYVHATGTKLTAVRESDRYLIVEGTLTEAVKGVAAYSIQFTSEPQPSLGNRDMPCVGSILRVKPRIDAAATLTPEEFKTMLTLATTDNLKSLTLYFQEPRYGSGLIASVSFFSHPPELE